MRIASASFSADTLIIAVLTLAGFGFVAARQQVKEGTAATPVPYNVTYDENGMLIRITVSADTDREQLRATLGSVADKHRDDPAPITSWTIYKWRLTLRWKATSARFLQVA